MGIQSNGPVPNQNNAFAVGSSYSDVFIPVFMDRNPTSFDSNYPIKKRWINITPGQVNEWILKSYSNTTGQTLANWLLLSDIPSSTIPNFKAYLSSPAPSVTGDGATYTIAFDTVLYGTGYTSPSFVAPFDGIYHFDASIWLTGLGAGHTAGLIWFACSNTQDISYIMINNPFACSSSSSYLISGSCDMKMVKDATVSVNVQVSGSTKTVDIFGQVLAGGTTTFSGYLVQET